MKKSNNSKPRINERPVVTVYVDPELLKKLDTLRTEESRSRGNMLHEILRRYFAKEALSA